MGSIPGRGQLDHEWPHESISFLSKTEILRQTVKSARGGDHLPRSSIPSMGCTFSNAGSRVALGPSRWHRRGEVAIGPARHECSSAVQRSFRSVRGARPASMALLGALYPALENVARSGWKRRPQSSDARRFLSWSRAPRQGPQLIRHHSSKPRGKSWEEDRPWSVAASLALKLSLPRTLDSATRTKWQ
jgi:hypothetical protein